MKKQTHFADVSGLRMSMHLAFIYFRYFEMRAQFYMFAANASIFERYFWENFSFVRSNGKNKNERNGWERRREVEREQFAILFQAVECVSVGGLMFD